MGTFRRLLGFLRPYRKQLWGSLVFAWAAMGMTVLIPWLIGHTINQIEDGRSTGDSSTLLPLVGLIVAGALSYFLYRRNRAAKDPAAAFRF